MSKGMRPTVAVLLHERSQTTARGLKDYKRLQDTDLRDLVGFTDADRVRIVSNLLQLRQQDHLLFRLLEAIIEPCE